MFWFLFVTYVPIIKNPRYLFIIFFFSWGHLWSTALGIISGRGSFAACYSDLGRRKNVACERRRISGCRFSSLFSAERSDSRKCVCVRRPEKTASDAERAKPMADTTPPPPPIPPSLHQPRERLSSVLDHFVMKDFCWCMTF